MILHKFKNYTTYVRKHTIIFSFSTKKCIPDDDEPLIETCQSLQMKF
jgi:hypothetical protein